MLAIPNNVNGPTSQSNGTMPPSVLQGQKSLFRVPLYRSAEARALEDSEKVYHARRPHRKSRGGCMKCKQRRVKCDETKPRCVRCQKHGVDCHYEAGQVGSARSVISYFLEHVPSLTASESAAYTMSLLAVASKIDELLQTDAKNLHALETVRALHFFHEMTSPTIGSERSQNALRGKIIQLAFHSPFLMHTVIGAATSHLRRIYPDESSYTVVEAYHWQRAIHQYSQEISTSVGPHNMDALYSACLLMTIHSFRLETHDPRSSFVFCDDVESLNWLLLQSGLRHLLYMTMPWMTQSMWWSVFRQPRENNALYDDHRTGRVGLHPDLADICGIDDTTTEESNPYHWPLRMLSPLLDMECTMKTFMQYTNFMGRLLPEYLEQLHRKDPPALIILSWWLSLILKLDVWWMETRARSECVAICMYLEDSDDPRVFQLLEFPAQTCGYVLRHVQERLNNCLL